MRSMEIRDKCKRQKSNLARSEGQGRGSGIGSWTDCRQPGDGRRDAYTRQQYSRHVRTRTRIRTAGYLTGLELAVRALAQLLHNSVTSLHKYE